jgi:dolichol-phosphate mannosyltransferase
LKYSVVIPIYNDAYLARDCCIETAKVFDTITGDFEILFINDGSKNDSLDVLVALSKEFSFVRVVELARNYGQHNALACGYKEARGEVVIRMNVDMQDPPSELPKLLKVFEAEDADLVVGQYATRKSPLTTKFSAWCYYALFKFMTGLNAEQNTSPMRVMSCRFIAAYNNLTEKSRFPQGLDLWLGFRQRYVEIEHRERVDKKSSYNFWSRFSLAVTGLLYFSDRPIKMVIVFGFIMGIIGFLIGGCILFGKVMGFDLLPGYASLAAIGLFTFGIQLTCLGLIGLYIGKIFKEVQNRPLYLVREHYGQGQ